MAMTQTKTTNYEITNYGIDNADYFRGHGTSFTRYNHAVLGCGDTYAEALDDALDSAAQMGFDIELETADLPEQPANNVESAWEYHCQHCEEDEHDQCLSNIYYYVGLRWN